MKNIKISIIITCYNLGLYLEEAVKNLLDLDEKENIEIIIVDDGTTDPLTLEVLARLRKVPFLRIIKQKNSGVGAARNKGISIAMGDLIIPLDADNRLRSHFIDLAIEIFSEHPEISVLHGNAEFFGKKKGIWKTEPFDLKKMVLINYIDACSCFRKSAWEDVSGFDEKMPRMGFEDWDLWLRLAVKGHNFYYLDEILFDYRVREKSMLSEAWDERELLVDYIFSKKELQVLQPLRECLISAEKLKSEPSIVEIIKLIKTKFLRKIK